MLENNNNKFENKISENQILPKLNFENNIIRKENEKEIKYERYEDEKIKKIEKKKIVIILDKNDKFLAEEIDFSDKKSQKNLKEELLKIISNAIS